MDIHIETPEVFLNTHKIIQIPNYIGEYNLNVSKVRFDPQALSSTHKVCCIYVILVH